MPPQPNESNPEMSVAIVPYTSIYDTVRTIVAMASADIATKVFLRLPGHAQASLAGVWLFVWGLLLLSRRSKSITVRKTAVQAMALVASLLLGVGALTF